MKIKIILAMIVASTLLYGCGNTDDAGSSRKRAEGSVQAINMEVEVSPSPVAINTQTAEPTTTPQATSGINEPIDVDSIVRSDAYNKTIIEFADQFLEYAALNLIYPESYGGEYLDDSMARMIIAYTEALGRTSDCPGVDYSSQYGYPMISAERFQELSQRFFRTSLDVSGLPLMDEQALYDNHLARSEAGDIYVSVGDWGLEGPVSDGASVSIGDGRIDITVHINMFDSETNSITEALGSYTITLYYDAEDPYNFYIGDFMMDYQ